MKHFILSEKVTGEFILEANIKFENKQDCIEFLKTLLRGLENQ